MTKVSEMFGRFERISRHEIEDLCRRARLKDMVARRVELKKWRERYWFGSCPFHTETTPSFTVNPQANRYYCFGCEEKGGPIDWLMAQENMTFLEAVEYLRDGTGLLSPVEARKAERKANEERQRREERDRRIARRIWDETGSLPNTLAELYLRQWRSITIPLPASLRFHPSCWCAETGERLPALVAGWQDVGGQFAAIHRIYLDPQTGNKAALAQPKKSLASTRGAAIRLGDAGTRLALVEGIESGLAVQELSGWPVWVGNFSNVELPETVRELTIAGDLDANGAGQSKTKRGAERFTRRGLTVRIALPDPIPGQRDTDWNDTLQNMKNERAAA